MEYLIKQIILPKNSKSSFSAASYASFRPQYSPTLFEKLMSYHGGPTRLAVDLGCGTGELTRRLADTLPDSAVLGIDSSPEIGRAIDFAEVGIERTTRQPDVRVDDCAGKRTVGILSQRPPASTAIISEQIFAIQTWIFGTPISKAACHDHRGHRAEDRVRDVCDELCGSSLQVSATVNAYA